MNRLMLVTAIALGLSSSFAVANPSFATEVIASRIANGTMTMAAVYNLISSSGLTYADVQNLTVPETVNLMSRLDASDD